MAKQLVYARLVIVTIIAALAVAACDGGGRARAGIDRILNDGGASGDVWLIDPELIVDGGPGRDGIPALQNPQFESIVSNTDVQDNDLVIAIRSGNQIRVYPHDIMDYHEIVNDSDGGEAFVVNYCPLTGSGFSWEADQTLTDKRFGVSGLLYNSNLILFDRETNSLWQQMLEISVNGERVAELPPQIKAIETTKATIRDMYPDAQIMTRNTGHIRDYDDYPYNDYRRGV